MRAPNVLNAIRNFNRTSSWAATELLRREDLQARRAVLRKLIMISKVRAASAEHASVADRRAGVLQDEQLRHCDGDRRRPRKQRSASPQEDVGGTAALSFSGVAESLKGVQEMDKEVQDAYNMLNEFSSINISKLREKLHLVEPPCVPYLGEPSPLRSLQPPPPTRLTRSQAYT